MGRGDESGAPAQIAPRGRGGLRGSDGFLPSDETSERGSVTTVFFATVLLTTACKTGETESLGEPGGASHELRAEATGRPVPITALREEPARWDGRQVQGAVVVAAVVDERGLWVETDAKDRLFVVVADTPAFGLDDFVAGQELYLSEATVRTPDSLGSVGSANLADVRQTVGTQPVVLVVEEPDVGLIGWASMARARRAAAWSTYDTDGDNRLTEAEYRAVLDQSQVWDRFDDDGDGRFSSDELVTGTFVTWDVDGDGHVDVDEYRRGWRQWPDHDADWTAFTDWDTDGDGRLSAAEFGTGWERAALYDRYEMGDDELLDADEYTHQTWSGWDVDGDGYVDMWEYPL